ncbi:Diacylglycerol kinase 1 [Eumeta japonica]|uniref:diacylglycerol kinase (ATP) n=1 Tax=Eumeta variegata TaxID=151549 RepID=A0A4C2A705_EUMVA|nr:Diacylglycerol kinase 1 [Eumeta japonica]
MHRYEGESIHKILDKIAKASTVMMDRWQIHVENTPTDCEQLQLPASTPHPTTVPYNIINNYFSIGVDAAICVKFHTERERNPDKFSSRMKNKLWYFEFATSEQFAASCKNLHENIDIVNKFYVVFPNEYKESEHASSEVTVDSGEELDYDSGETVIHVLFLAILDKYLTTRAIDNGIPIPVATYCDGASLELSKGPSLQGVALLNIPYAHGGSNLWGSSGGHRIPYRSTSIDFSCKVLSGWLKLSICFTDIGDKLIEVIGLENCLHMGQVRTGLRASGRRLAQCSSITITTKRTFPMQIDGEPWMQPPSKITITHKNQVPMLMGPEPEKGRGFFKLFSHC